MEYSISMEATSCVCGEVIKSKDYLRCSSCRESRRIRQKKQRLTPEGKAKIMIKEAKARAKKKGIKFSLSDETITSIIEIVKKGYCQFSKHKFEFISSSPWAPTIDRINSSKGYVDGNVWVVCWIHNCSKHSWDAETHKQYVLEAAQAYGLII